jgi:diguanylate cyclase (GGDEF)-like protein
LNDTFTRFGRFRDPKRERAFRFRDYSSRRRDLQVAITVTAILYACTALEYVGVAVDDTPLSLLIALRTGIVLFAVGAIVGVRRSVFARSTKILVALYLVSLGVSESYELTVGVSEWSHVIVPVASIMVLAFYFFVRYSLVVQVAAGVGVTLLYLGTMAVVLGGPPARMLSAALLFSLVNIVGIYQYIVTEARARREFLLLVEERSLTKKLRQEQSLNARLLEQLKLRSTTDHLTSIANRRAFEEHLNRHHSLAIRHSRPLSLVLIDIDRFKQINDRYGHPVGDEVLRSTADVLIDVSRGEDLPGRLGGDELGIILPETENSGAASIASRVLDALHERRVDDGSDETIKASIGVATLDPDETVERFWERADRALYAAKETGRDRICNTGRDHAPLNLA